MSPPEELPYLTHDLPGTGGVIKSHASDFEVEEIPLYQPAGAGTHSYLWIEKEGLTTFDAIRLVARALGKKERDVGYAGLKDARARTRQWLSVEHAPDLAPLAVDLPPALKVLATSRHQNKLRVGHLRGNRFRLRVRGVGALAEPRARAILDRLARTGMPAFFGAQRFGMHSSTHELGRALLCRDAAGFFERLLSPGAADALARIRSGRLDAALEAIQPGPLHRYERDAVRALQRARGDRERAVAMLDRRMLRFYLAAYQSQLFNRVLAARLGTCDRLIAGDVAYLHRNGACFEVVDLDREQPRAAAFEISPSGPLFGPAMLLPREAALGFEQAVLAAEGVSADQFGAGPVRLDGARRPLRSPLTDIAVAAQGDELVVQFALPPGMYASVALREITKTGAPCELTADDAHADAP
ncbi:MAG: tRNA pseudouridine(13) synthase TruD [Planctomycetota bacterium]